MQKMKGSVSLVISNPPLGQRVKVANLHALYSDLFKVAAEALKANGKLVLINPLKARPRAGSAEEARLRLVERHVVDLGLRRDCSVEVWERA